MIQFSQRSLITAFVALMWSLGICSAGHAECLSSAKAVWAAHPGSHATWRLRLPGHEGTKCWFAKSSTYDAAPRVQQDHLVDSARKTEAPLRTDGQANGVSAEVKASAADRADESSTRLQSQDSLIATGRLPLSILIWGKPMRIDATWEEIFARRERGAE